MEDNEFEEVTIISHTEAETAKGNKEGDPEQLKARVTLVAVKEIAVRNAGRAYASADPRLAPGLRELEKLKQDHFEEFRPTHFAPFNFISRVAGESGQYLLGADGLALLSNGQTSKVVNIGRGSVGFILPWGNHFLTFATNRYVIVHNLNFEFFKEIDSRKQAMPDFEAFRSVASTPNHVFYLMQSQAGIARLDRSLEIEIVFNSGGIQDFFVCPKTETITTLHKGSDGCFILRNMSRVEIKKTFFNYKFSILKKMYSDHFLVGESENQDLMRHNLHLICDKTLSCISNLEFRTQQWNSIGNIRLLAPRQGINCFLVSAVSTLELFCEYRLKLYHLKTLKVLSYSSCLSYLRSGLWAVTSLQTTVLIAALTF